VLAAFWRDSLPGKVGRRLPDFPSDEALPKKRDILRAPLALSRFDLAASRFWAPFSLPLVL
jgi:hypothetical protein